MTRFQDNLISKALAHKYSIGRNVREFARNLKVVNQTVAQEVEALLGHCR